MDSVLRLLKILPLDTMEVASGLIMVIHLNRWLWFRWSERKIILSIHLISFLDFLYLTVNNKRY